MIRAKHVHKYERTKLGTKGYEVYKCRAVDCPHYVPVTLAVGRLSMCWNPGCSNAVMLDTELVDHDKVWRPFCPVCRKERAEKRKQKQEYEIIESEGDVA